MEQPPPRAVLPLQTGLVVPAAQRPEVPGPKEQGAGRQGRADAQRVVCWADLIVLDLTALVVGASAAKGAEVRPGLLAPLQPVGSCVSVAPCGGRAEALRAHHALLPVGAET